MNIALSAVILFILLLPGFSFYMGLYTGKHTKPAPKFSVLESLLLTALFSLLIHLVGLQCIHTTIRFDVLLKLMGVDQKEILQQRPLISNQSFSALVKEFFIYNSVVNLLCASGGIVARKLILHFNLDWKYAFLRLNNKWFYAFNGYQLGVKEAYLIYVDALVHAQEGSVIYTGFLEDFLCNGEELDRIYLKSVTRRKATIPEHTDATAFKPGAVYELEGDTFCLPAKEIKNLMLRFYVVINTTQDQEVVVVNE
jgi:hypothetical protein